MRRYKQCEIDFLKDHAHEMTIDELCEKLDRNVLPLRAKLQSLKIKCKRKRLHYPNEDYFTKYSYNMFYIVGFTMADGCVWYGNQNVNNKVLEYTISDRDRQILEFIKCELCNSIDIKECESRESSLCKLSNGKLIRFRLASDKICNDLEKFAIIPRKTGKEELVNIPKDYFYSYLLGFMDGDGCVWHSKTKNRYGTEYLTGTIAFYCSNREYLEQLKKFEGNNLGSIHTRINSHGNKISHWQIRKFDEILLLYQNMYSCTSFCLERKRQKMENILKYKNLI